MMSFALASKIVNPIVILVMGLAMLTVPFTTEAVKILSHDVGVYYGRLADKEFIVNYESQGQQEPSDVKISVRLKGKTGETSTFSYNRKGKTPLHPEEKEILQRIVEAVNVYNETNKRTIPDKVRYAWQEIKRGITRK